MKIHLSFVIATTTFMIASCSASKVMLNPEYKNQIVSAKNIAIVIQDKKPGIFYNANTKLLLGKGDKDSLIWNFYKEKLTKQIKFNLKSDEVFFDNIADQFYSSIELISTKHSSYEISIPGKGTKLNFESGKEADLVFLIDKIGIGTEFSVTPSAGFMGPYGFSSAGASVKKELVFRSDFILWDNISKKPVTYGHLESKASGAFPIITRLTWEKAISKYVNLMLSKANFE